MGGGIPSSPGWGIPPSGTEWGYPPRGDLGPVEVEVLLDSDGVPPSPEQTHTSHTYAGGKNKWV